MDCGFIVDGDGFYGSCVGYFLIFCVVYIIKLVVYKVLVNIKMIRC